MKVEEIFDEWVIDSEIDKTKLTEASLKTPVLHAKYLRLLFQERLMLRKLEQDLKDLRLKKKEFIVTGHSEIGRAHV